LGRWRGTTDVSSAVRPHGRVIRNYVRHATTTLSAASDIGNGMELILAKLGCRYQALLRLPRYAGKDILKDS
jgi:hypothetical protein